jgi:predicted HNH restriction endonuclease
MPSVYTKEYYQKNRERLRATAKRYYDANKEKECARVGRHYQQNKNEIDEQQKTYYLQSKLKVVALFGGKCQICGRSDRQFAFHQKYGKSHGTKSRTHLLALASPEDFALVCKFPCHRFVHNCMDIFSMTWIEVMQFVKERAEWV